MSEDFQYFYIVISILKINIAKSNNKLWNDLY